MVKKRISLSYRPRGCRYVQILGIKPNLADYCDEHRRLISNAVRILYPTGYYAQLLADAGKTVFPSPRHYYYTADKIRQTGLFQMLGINHPHTKVFFGRQSATVLDYFSYPFIAKFPYGYGQGRGVFLIKNHADWVNYLKQTRVAYVQEFFPIERDMRIVVIAGRLITAYWRNKPHGDFRTNLYQGGRADFNKLSEEGIFFGVETAQRCGFEDVGLDVCHHDGQWWILEANMRYGLEGITAAGISLPRELDKLILEGVI